MMTQVLCYSRVVEKPETVVFRVAPSLKAAFDTATADRKISQQDAGRALLEWFVDQDPATQAMVLGQLPANDDLVELVLNRLKKRDVAGKIQPRVSPQDRKEAASKNLKK